MRDVGVLEQVNSVNGVTVASPEDTVTPRGDAGLAGGVIHICARIKLEGGGKGQLALLVSLHMYQAA